MSDAPTTVLHGGATAPTRTWTPQVRFDCADRALAHDRKATPRVHFNLRSRTRKLQNHCHEVTLELSVDCRSGAAALWHLEVHQAGMFDLTSVAPADTPRMLNTVCARALLLLAKRKADALVLDAGFPPFELPPVDLAAVYRHYQGGPVPAGPVDALREFWQAVRHLQAAGHAKQQPADFHAMHGEALAVAQRSRDVLSAADQVLATKPSDESLLHALAAAYSLNGLYRQAATVYALAVATRPGDARARYNLATALMFNGNLGGAERAIDEAIRLQPTLWDAYTVRSQVRRQTADRNHVDALEALLRRVEGDPVAAERLHLSLAKEYDDLGEYGRAFPHLAEGNRIGKLHRGYDFSRDARVFDALRDHAPSVSDTNAGNPDEEPIFVFGMPRSGTTLVDRILSCHPDIESAGELKQFGMLLKYACGSPTEDVLDADTIMRAQALDWRTLGEQYIASTRPITGHVRHFIDKFPHHFLYAAHIANALPQAKLICVRRSAMDTCLGNFRQVFSEGSPFHGYACDLCDAGRYYARFDELLRGWCERLPGRILEVSYETLVAQPEPVIRRVLAFCGLDWNPACLHFEENPAPVATASAAEVRRPLYRDAIGRWRHYAHELAPLAELLTRAGIPIDAG